MVSMVSHWNDSRTTWVTDPSMYAALRKIIFFWLFSKCSTRICSCTIFVCSIHWRTWRNSFERQAGISSRFWWQSNIWPLQWIRHRRIADDSVWVCRWNRILDGSQLFQAQQWEDWSDLVLFSSESEKYSDKINLSIFEDLPIQ